jgi:hypothetical protein
MRGVYPPYDEVRERGEMETHLIPGIYWLSQGEEVSDLSKVTIPGSGVDGPSGTSGRAHVATEFSVCVPSRF